MRRNCIPSIGGLTSFVAAAQHRSFTSAAKELCISQGAVSRQIRELEAHLGVRLFERIRQRVVLTEAGKLFLSEVKKPLEDIMAASQRASALCGGTTLALAISPTLASRWLMPRLSSFQKKNPAIIIHMATPLSPAEFAVEPFDVAIFYGSPNWPGTIAQHFMYMDMIAVCSPRLKANTIVKTPADITKLPLLHHWSRPNRWHDWMSEAGLAPNCQLCGHTYQSFALLAQASVSGLGIALLPRYAIETELATKQLEVVGRNFPTLQLSYYLIVREACASSKIVQCFAEWIAAETRRSSGLTEADETKDVQKPPMQTRRPQLPDRSRGLTV